ILHLPKATGEQSATLGDTCSSIVTQPTLCKAGQDVRRSVRAGDVLHGPCSEAPRGEGLPLRMRVHGAVLLLLLRDVRVLPRLPLLLLQLDQPSSPWTDGPRKMLREINRPPLLLIIPQNFLQFPNKLVSSLAR
uniref:Uncharacterized protein n=1 Tax=Triticum urartu TaxID=4572 RepID=A0A8R7UXN3_TRIUA